MTVTMVTVGYGDITPVNEYERMFSVLTILLACGIFAYSINEIGQIIQNFSSQSRRAQQSMRVINNYMN